MAVFEQLKRGNLIAALGLMGAIRKISMLVSVAFLLILDRIVGLNLIGFIPAAARAYLPANHIGVAEFFALLYIAYEVVSILKNMTLCGLPVKHLWQVIRDGLKKYTSELPDNKDEVAPK